MAYVLIIDDEPDTREVLGRILRMEGHSVAYAGNGWEGLISVQEKLPDLILLDVMMPGMDGPTFLKVLQRQSEAQLVPIVVITAFGESEAAQRIKRMGVTAMLPKTQRLLDELMDLVRSILGD